MACEYYKSATLMGLTPSTLQQQCLEGSQWHSSTLLRWHRLHDLDRTKHKAKGCYYDTTEADHCVIEKIIRPIHPAEAVNTVQPLQCRKLCGKVVMCKLLSDVENMKLTNAKGRQTQNERGLVSATTVLCVCSETNKRKSNKLVKYSTPISMKGGLWNKAWPKD